MHSWLRCISSFISSRYLSSYTYFLTDLEGSSYFLFMTLFCLNNPNFFLIFCLPPCFCDHMLYTTLFSLSLLPQYLFITSNLCCIFKRHFQNFQKTHCLSSGANWRALSLDKKPLSAPLNTSYDGFSFMLGWTLMLFETHKQFHLSVSWA